MTRRSTWQRVCDSIALDRYEPGETIALDASRVRRNNDGTITVPARVARSGTQEYSFGRVGRPPEEVTAADSLASIPGRAVTVQHPPRGWIYAQDWGTPLVVGVAVGTPRVVTLDDDGSTSTWIETDLLITHIDTARRVLAGELCEISSGYEFRRDEKIGQSADASVKFDQRDIRHNHFALLQKGEARAGKFASILKDSKDTMTEAEMQAKIQAADAARAADAAELARVKTEHAALLRAKADADTALAVEQAKRTSQDAIDAGVRDALELRTQVGVLVKGAYPFGDSPANEVRRAVLAKMGRKIAADASDEYVRARFESEVDHATHAAPALTPALTPAADAAEKKTPHQQHLDRLRDAGKVK